jgi:hypothetical protein
MDEQSIRIKIREKLASRKLPNDLQPQKPQLWPISHGGTPPGFDMRSARPGEVCAACDKELAAFSDCPTDMFTTDGRSQMFVFHLDCGDLYEKEAWKFRISHPL